MIWRAQCGNYGILVSHFFGKNFVKATVLLYKSLKSWFDKIFFWQDTVWKFANFSPTNFCKNSVKLTFSLKSYTINQFDENFLQWGKISEITTLWTVNFSFFHTVLYAQCWKFGNFPPPLQKFSVKLIYSICNSLVKKLIWRNFCKISWGKNLQISTLWYVRAHIAYIHVCSMVWKLPSSHQNIISWSQLSTLVITYFII